ncbi:hypothetical protein [Haloferula sp. A504]|uniref:hypothetical protein n=1 Tax=Haloferula sp. A504 TaxID=3373601 RepID=UPI0031C11B8F|nr:LamG domain-containing protein [Verrucomicrobiaceae bacterium E54]
MNTNCITLLALGALTGLGTAATVTQQVLVNFDGIIAGNAYTLGAGEIDTTGTFGGRGNPAVTSGEADLTGGFQGFYFDSSSLGALTTQNWIAETRVSFDAFGTGQLTVIDVQGDTDFRINNAGTALEAVYWDGSTAGSQTASLPSTGTTIHMALVWDATATSLTGYIDGTSIGTVDNGAFATPDGNVSFGYLGRAGFEGRGINGQLDGVAFSTFTGTFDASTDFQIIPEPSSIALFIPCGMILLRRRRK